MNIDIIYAFMYNILILLGLAVIYSIFPVQTNHKPILRKILMGFFVFIIGFMVMINSYNYTEGIFYDARSVIISISGMFLGLIPTIIGMIGLIVTRIFMGGAGVYAGVLSIFVSGGLGLLWRYYRLKNRNIDISDISILELYLIGVLVSMFVLLSQLLLPWETFENILPKILLPLLVIYPLGSLFVSLFMITQRKHYFQQVAMHQSEMQYRSLFSKSSTPHLLVYPKTKEVIDANEAACNLYGYTYEELTRMHVNKLNATLDNVEINNEMKEIMGGKNKFFQFKHRSKDGRLIDVEVHAGPVTIENNIYVFATIIDVTSQLEQERMFRDVDERLHATLLSVGEGITVCDKYGKIQLMNNKATELLGIEKAPVGERITEVFRIFSNAGKPAFQEVYSMVNKSQSVYRSDSSYTLLTNDNDREIFVDFTLSPISINGNKTNGEILVLRNITI